MASVETDDILQILEHASSASLATYHAKTSMPYVSLVNVAVDKQGPIILISDLAWHTKNLQVQPQGSLLFVESQISDTQKPKDPLEGKRVTLLGKFNQVDDKQVRQVYLTMHPDAQVFERFTDFSYWRLQPQTIHAIAGFGAITTLNASQIFDKTHSLRPIINN